MLILGVLLNKSHSILYAIDPSTKDYYVGSWFMIPQPQVNVLWYLKGITDDLLMCIVFYILSQISKLISRRLFYIFSIFFVYYIFNVVMFVINYKQWRFMFHIAFIFIIAALIQLVWPMKKRGQVKELK